MEKLLGFWIEYREGFGSIYLKEESFNDSSNYNVEKIKNYLSNGIPLGGLRTMGQDLNDGEEIGPLITYTDGSWFWTTEYMFYLQKYNLKIVPQFLTHLEQRDFVPPHSADFPPEKTRELGMWLSETLRAGSR